MILLDLVFLQGSVSGWHESWFIRQGKPDELTSWYIAGNSQNSSPSTGEDKGGGDKIIGNLTVCYFPLPFIPSRQGRGNMVS
jgi:hypothetical protein